MGRASTSARNASAAAFAASDKTLENRTRNPRTPTGTIDAASPAEFKISPPNAQRCTHYMLASKITAIPQRFKPSFGAAALIFCRQISAQIV
jgi:hypothetical protein